MEAVSETTPLKGTKSADKPSGADDYIRRHSSYTVMLAEEHEQEMEDGLANTYDLEKLITWRVFGVVEGTVLQNKTLWTETIAGGVCYFLIYGAMLHFRWKDFTEFLGSESTIRAFIAMLSTLVGLLLSFYTALNLGRWWQMREGVHKIQEGCKRLAMFISNGVTGDVVLLDTIHRYARASLYLIFRASVCPEGHTPRSKAVDIGLLTQEESTLLEECNPHMPFIQAEILWVWLGNAISRLHDKGMTKGPPHYCALMGAVELGRGGIAEIQSYLETPIPMGYAHLLCLMVKLHNLIITVMMALTCVMLSGGEKGFQAIGVFRVTFRAFFMPFLYNALLILNAEVVDPFGEDKADFHFSAFDLNMHKGTTSFTKANTKIPACLALPNVQGVVKK